MPLIGGKRAKTRAGMSANIRTEMAAGKKRRQAVAIAYAQARRGQRKGT